eukprot:GHVR01094797.1.p1 GENE.GHVR01094797.1~~GHVR01094797.1.p1  ORF type:complete len:479 (+),score=67.27 GHVR01094797.1:377-1813(+)
MTRKHTTTLGRKAKGLPFTSKATSPLEYPSACPEAMSPIVGRNVMSIDTRHLTLSDSGRRMSLPTVTNTPQRGRRRDTHTCSINVLTDSTHDTNTQGEAIVDPIVEDDYEQDTPKHTHTQETTNDGTQDFPWSAEPQPISPFSYRRAGIRVRAPVRDVLRVLFENLSQESFTVKFLKKKGADTIESLGQWSTQLPSRRVQKFTFHVRQTPATKMFNVAKTAVCTEVLTLYKLSREFLVVQVETAVVGVPFSSNFRLQLRYTLGTVAEETQIDFEFNLKLLKSFLLKSTLVQACLSEFDANIPMFVSEAAESLKSALAPDDTGDTDVGDPQEGETEGYDSFGGTQEQCEGTPALQDIAVAFSKGVNMVFELVCQPVCRCVYSCVYASLVGIITMVRSLLRYAVSCYLESRSSTLSPKSMLTHTRTKNFVKDVFSSLMLKDVVFVVVLVILVWILLLQYKLYLWMSEISGKLDILLELKE